MARVRSVMSELTSSGSSERKLILDVREHQISADTGKCQCRRNKSETWNDHFVSWPDLGEQRCHLERVRAGGGEDYLPGLEPFIEESGHTLGEWPARRCVARD